MASLEWRYSKRKKMEYPRLIVQIDGKRYRPRIPEIYMKSEAEDWLRRFNQMGIVKKIEVLMELGVIEETSDESPDVEPEQLLFDDVVIKYLSYCKKTQRENTVRKKTSRFNTVWLPEFEGDLLVDILPADIQVILAEKRDEGYALNTLHNDAKELKALFNWAVENGLYKGNNPVGKLPPSELREITVLDVNDAYKYLEKCSPDYFPIASVALLAGLRKGEIKDLQWRDIDFDARMIRIRSESSHKNARGRNIPLRDDLAAVLHKLTRGSRFVFPGKDGMKQKVTFRKSHYTARKDAGFPDLRFHDLRHTFASILISGGASITVVSKLMGHSSDRVTRRIYFHLLPNKAVEVINGHPLNLPGDHKFFSVPKKRTQKKKTTFSDGSQTSSQPFVQKNGGDDEARTRDLRRDSVRPSILCKGCNTTEIQNLKGIVKNLPLASYARKAS